MKAVDISLRACIDFNKENNEKDPNFKIVELVIMLEYQDIKIFLQNVTLQIGRQKFLLLKKS